jgi:hypothetical protein
MLFVVKKELCDIFDDMINYDEVVFHKPGDTITDNNSPHELKLPFGLKTVHIPWTVHS